MPHNPLCWVMTPCLRGQARSFTEWNRVQNTCAQNSLSKLHYLLPPPIPQQTILGRFSWANTQNHKIRLQSIWFALVSEGGISFCPHGHSGKVFCFCWGELNLSETYVSFSPVSCHLGLLSSSTSTMSAMASWLCQCYRETPIKDQSIRHSCIETQTSTQTGKRAHQAKMK